jgi:hypothetical protein
MTRILESVTNLPTLTVILIAAAAVLLLMAFWFARRRRANKLYQEELPPLVFAVHDRVSAPPDMRPATFGVRAGYPGPSAPPPQAPAPQYYAPVQPVASAPPPPLQWQPPAGPGVVGQRGDEGAGRDGNGNGQHAAADENTTRVPRYQGPVTMAFLPGRLEVQTAGSSGPRPGEVIRFPARRQGDGTVILGRDDGPSGATVKVPAESVSRRHARMQFENGRWKISNLSRTNPTLVNGEELIVTDGARWLYDGDIIEMGEMVFRFHDQ